MPSVLKECVQTDPVLKEWVQLAWVGFGSERVVGVEGVGADSAGKSGGSILDMNATHDASVQAPRALFRLAH
jgi:hypothetical protein